MRWRADRLACVALALSLAACAGREGPRGASSEAVKIGRPYTIKGVTYYPRDDRHYDEVGLASWYGSESGRTTANGETFHPNRISAAHKTLPLPSYVEVTALDTGRSILVRVNDRGPFYPGRIIDLSRGAAVALGTVGKAPARVRVRRVEPSEKVKMALRAGREVPGGGKAVRFAAAAPVVAPVPPSRSIPPIPQPPIPQPPVARSPVPQPPAPVPVASVPVASVPPAPVMTVAPRPPLSLDLPPPEPETITAVPLPPSTVSPADPGMADVAPVAGGWFVQLGVFADRGRADSLLPLPDGMGLASVEPVSGLWRVRAGPYDEVQARAALAQFRARGYQDAVLVRPE